MTLKETTTDRILALLRAYMEDIQHREALIRKALGGCDILQQINWQGSADEFCAQLIETLDKFGSCEPGKTSLVSVLETLRREVSINQQPAFDELIQELTNSDSTDPRGPASDTTLPDPSQSPRSRDHIFISYAHEQQEMIAQLVNDLEKSGHTVWVDKGLLYGDVWRQEIVDGIYWSSAVLLALSPDSIGSEWVRVEYQTALKYGKLVIPLIFAPIPELEAVFRHLNLDENIQYPNFIHDYKNGLHALLESEKFPVPAKVKRHCQQVVLGLEKNDWVMDHFITERAKTLPMNASPYGLRGNSENLIARLQQTEKAVVLGEPGSGKTVALERLAWEQATKTPPDIPILLSLMSYEGGSLLERIHSVLSETRELELHTIDDTIRLLNISRGYFLLDGFNEVPTEYRREILDEIRKLISSFPRYRMVVTSRIQDETWKKLLIDHRSFEALVIDPIRPEDAQAYLQSYFGRLEAVHLWGKRLDSKLRELATTPLILRLIREAWGDQRTSDSPSLPSSRGELYEYFVYKRLKEDEIRISDNKINRRVRLAALEKLALEMQTKGNQALREDDVFDLVENEEIVSDLRRHGFLREIDGRISFPHQTFQEYFAARALRRDFTPYLKYTQDSRWVETFVQLAGLIDTAEDLVRLLQELAATNPWLAWWCIREGKEVDEKTRNLIEANSIGLVLSPFVEERRGAAQVLAQLQEPRVIKELIILVKDDDDEVSSTARIGLNEFGEGVTPDLLAAFYDNLTTPRRIRVGQALGDVEDPREGVGVLPNGIPRIDWVTVPAGILQMRRNKAEIFVKEFQISRYLVTHAQFDAFLKASDGYCVDDLWTESGLKWRRPLPRISVTIRYPDFDLANHPCIFVSWYEAIAFCRWLSVKLGYNVRLATESEWMRAAYGDIDSTSSSNDSFDPYRANTLETGLRKPSAVGCFFASHVSPFGVMDITGNAFCWCMTQWREDLSEPENNESEGDVPRVLRGSSFSHIAEFDRMGDFPHYASYFSGFRLVRPGDTND